MKHVNSKTMQTLWLTCCIGLLSASSMAIAGNGESASANCTGDSKLKDVWVEARLESAYLFNPNLNNFGITTHAENGTVRLTGEVKSDIDKDLAGEIAKSLDGVTTVENDLEVKANLDQETANGNDADRKFGQVVADATITAKVKTKLLANDNISGTDIDVDTENNVVSLTGKVKTAVQKQLAEYIARNTSGVKSVNSSHLAIIDAAS